MRHLTQEEQDNVSPAGDEEDCLELEEEAEAVLVAGVGRGEEEEEGAGVGDEITLPLLTDREPSPRAREMSSSRWMSNDDASDGEQTPTRLLAHLFSHVPIRLPSALFDPNTRIGLVFSAREVKIAKKTTERLCCFCGLSSTSRGYDALKPITWYI